MNRLITFLSVIIASVLLMQCAPEDFGRCGVAEWQYYFYARYRKQD